MQHNQTAGRYNYKKVIVWLFWGVNAVIIAGVWLAHALPDFLQGNAATVWYAFARLSGLAAMFCVLTQFILMGRVGWLEPVFGMDRLAIFHRYNGYAAIICMLAHSSLMTTSYAWMGGVSPLTQSAYIAQMPYVLWAILAQILFIVTVFISIYIVRKHVKFETWYAVHVLNYVAIILVPWHQIVNGKDFLDNQLFTVYWLGLHVFVAANVIWWRFMLPIIRSFYFGFTVEKIVQETPSAVSVYITGRNLQKFNMRGGQFIMVRFMQKGFRWQEHPFSLSMLPNNMHIRITARQLGDFTGALPLLKPGTKVVVSGPHGSFTRQRQRTRKSLYIAGGIGITPLRAMLEEQGKEGTGQDVKLLYGNRTEADTALLSELHTISAQLHMPLYNVVSEEPAYEGEKGFIDKEKIFRLVPDVAERDIFLCGPPPMMAAVKKALQELHVPADHVHYERFSLHKK